MAIRQLQSGRLDRIADNHNDPSALDEPSFGRQNGASSDQGKRDNRRTRCDPQPECACLERAKLSGSTPGSLGEYEELSSAPEYPFCRLQALTRS